MVSNSRLVCSLADPSWSRRVVDLLGAAAYHLCCKTHPWLKQKLWFRSDKVEFVNFKLLPPDVCPTSTHLSPINRNIPLNHFSASACLEFILLSLMNAKILHIFSALVVLFKRLSPCIQTSLSCLK